MLEPLLLKNPDGPHPTGKNLCFSNAVVQLLRHNLHFQQHVIFKRSSDNNVFNELYRILRHQGTTSLASCANLRRIIGMTVGNDDLWSGNQQDAVEFLTFLLNNLDEECKQISSTHCIMPNTFTAEFHSTTAVFTYLDASSHFGKRGCLSLGLSIRR